MTGRMKTVEISYSHQVQQALLHATKMAQQLCHGSVGTEHLLMGILHIKEASLSELLHKKGITEPTIIQEVQILFGFSSSSNQQVAFTSMVCDVLNCAEHKAQQSEENEVSIDHLSIALLESENNVALELLRRHDIVVEQVMEQLTHQNIFCGMHELTNLNEKVRSRKGKIIGREKELFGIISVLLRMEKSNCVLTGPAGVGKSAIVEELASRIEKGKVPDELKHCVVAELSVNRMVAGTKYRGEFEKKIQQLMDYLKENRNVILFIDELHLIVGAGKAEGSLDIASVLKPVLARNEFRVIGATTQEEYERWIKKDKALERRFVRIDVKEPDEVMTLSMLKEKAKDLAKYHQIHFQKGILNHCISMSKIALPQLKFPDKAIDLLDMSCSCARCTESRLVDVNMLNQAASYLSERPAVQEISLFNELQHAFSLDQIEQMKQSLHDVLVEHKSILWKLGDTASSLLKEQLKKIHAQIIEINVQQLNEMTSKEILEYFKNVFKDNQFHVLWVNHAQQLCVDLMNLCSYPNADSSGCLIVMQHDHQKEKPGFVQKKENHRFEAIVMDESLYPVVS